MFVQRSISRCRASCLRRSPGGCGVFKLILGQPSHIGTICSHHENLTIWLAVEEMQHRLIQKAATRARERNPFTVPGPSHVCIIARRPGEPFQVSPIRADCVNLIVPVAVAGERNSIPNRGSGRKVIVLWSSCQLGYPLNGKINDAQPLPCLSTAR